MRLIDADALAAILEGWEEKAADGTENDGTDGTTRILHAVQTTTQEMLDLIANQPTAAALPAMNRPQTRPCIAHPGRKALFHRFVNVAEVAAPSIMVGGHPGGQLQNTYALMEYEDGRLSMEPINSIIMLDGAEQFAAHDWEALGADAKAREKAAEKAGPIPRRHRRPGHG